MMTGGDHRGPMTFPALLPRELSLRYEARRGSLRARFFRSSQVSSPLLSPREPRRDSRKGEEWGVGFLPATEFFFGSARMAVSFFRPLLSFPAPTARFGSPSPVPPSPHLADPSRFPVTRVAFLFLRVLHLLAHGRSLMPRLSSLGRPLPPPPGASPARRAACSPRAPPLAGSHFPPRASGSSHSSYGAACRAGLRDGEKCRCTVLRGTCAAESAATRNRPRRVSCRSADGVTERHGRSIGPPRRWSRSRRASPHPISTPRKTDPLVSREERDRRDLTCRARGIERAPRVADRQ